MENTISYLQQKLLALAESALINHRIDISITNPFGKSKIARLWNAEVTEPLEMASN